MSRIHDALKRAEHERASNTDPQGSAGIGKMGAPADHQKAWQSVTGETKVMARQLESGSQVEANLLSALMERCPRYVWNPNPKAIIFTNEQNQAAGTEEFRTLRSRLHLARKQQPLQKLLITSPLPKEGKTFIAANLARIIVTQPEHRLLLVDGDLRMPALHLSLGAPQAPGLSEYLRGEADEFAVIQRGTLDNFFFLPSGKQLSNPSELIGNGRLKVLLNRVSSAFDWIVMDSPPAVPVSDAKLLADVCDGVLVMIQVGSTPFDLAQKACQEFGERKFLGVVLNRVDAKSTYSSYYYSQERKAVTGNRKG